jgi:hypothetical protein
MWVQCDEPPGGEPVDVPREGGRVDELLGVSAAVAVAVAGTEPVEVGISEVELLVAALATAAPPPTRTPASPIPASVCRSRIFIPFTSFDRVMETTPRGAVRPTFRLTALGGSDPRLSGSRTTLRPVSERGLAASWQFPKPGSTEKLLVVQCSAGRRSFDPQTFGVSRNTDSRARWVRDSCCFRVLSVASNEGRPRRGRRVQVTSTIDRCRRMASSNRCAHGQRVGR